jgi:hypothetical protein
MVMKSVYRYEKLEKQHVLSVWSPLLRINLLLYCNCHSARGTEKLGNLPWQQGQLKTKDLGAHILTTKVDCQDQLIEWLAWLLPQRSDPGLLLGF